MKKLFHFFRDSYYGCLSGLFISTQEEVDAAIGQKVDLGEALGKHSEVFFKLNSNHCRPIELSESTLTELEEKLGPTLCGYNPFEYMGLEDKDEDSSM